MERAREAVRSVESEIKELIIQKGKDGKLKLEFEDLEIFGTPEDTRVVYLKLKEEGD